MGVHWLADVEPETFWANHAWPDFAALPRREYAVVVLPVCGFGPGPEGDLDHEETDITALLRAASEMVPTQLVIRVLPPLRFVPSGSGGLFGIEPALAADLIQEIAAGVKAAGFQKLVFLNASAASEPFLHATALDVRAVLGLRTYVIRAHARGFDPARPQTADQVGAGPELARLLLEIGQHLAPPLPAGAAGPAPPSRPPAAAGPYPAYRDRYLPALSRAELGARAARHDSLVIVPAAAIEQHGRHLPVGTDAIIGQALVRALLARIPADRQVLVAPAITYGKSNEHFGFAGTLSISARSLRGLVLAISAQLRALGFRRVAILNTHGGNSAVLAAITREGPTDATDGLTILRPDVEPELEPQEAAWGFHAGDWETSVMLACAPELVRLDRAVAEYPARLGDPGVLRPEHAAATYAWMTRDISRSGVIGDPRQASAEKGRRWLEAAADRLVKKIAE